MIAMNTAPTYGDEWMIPAELAAHFGIPLDVLSPMLALDPVLSVLKRGGRFPLSRIHEFLDGCI